MSYSLVKSTILGLKKLGNLIPVRMFSSGERTKVSIRGCHVHEQGQGIERWSCTVNIETISCWEVL